MQSAGVNALMALAGGTAASSRADATQANADDHSADGQFAQLLNDSGTPSQEQPAPQSARVQAAATTGSGVLAAQEVAGSQASGLRQLLPLQNQQVNPKDAAELIQKIDDYLAQQKGQNQGNASNRQDQANNPAPQTETTELAALVPLKTQLQAIVDSGTPKTVAEIVHAEPAVKQSKLAWAALGSLFSGRTSAKSADENPAQEASAPVNAAATNAAAATIIPASLFRPDHADHAPKADQPTEQADSKKKKTRDVTLDTVVAMPSAEALPAAPANVAATSAVVVPMTVAATLATPIATDATAQSSTIDDVLATHKSAPVSPMTLADLKALSPESATQSTASGMPPKPRDDLDDAIPPLTLSGNDALPQVELPDALPLAKSSNLAASQTAANNGLVPFAASETSDTKTLVADKAVGATNDTTNALNPSAVAGHSATQTAQAVQPLSLVHSANVINHAPVSDQVNLAVSKASKDGIDHLTIQLDPVGLGRVEVQMHTTKEGQTHIAFTIDKPETFDNLSRDARTLERSLQEAGIKADTGSMQFNLRQQSQQHQMQSDAGGQGQFKQPQLPLPQDKQASTSSTIPVASLARNYTINIREGVDISA